MLHANTTLLSFLSLFFKNQKWKQDYLKLLLLLLLLLLPLLLLV